MIGLELCPFAGRAAAAGLVRFRVTRARTPRTLLRELAEEALFLAATDPKRVETTLLIHPRVLGEFLAFNEFLGLADALLDDLGLTGVLQVASFHPRYRFRGTAQRDPANCTNRSPFPTLQLLREASIERALAAFPDPSSIYRRNVRTLRRLGADRWQALAARFLPARCRAMR